MKETWKDIEAYEGQYQVSNHGRVRSLARCWTGPFGEICLPERIMVLNANFNGYLYIKLRRGPIHKKFYIHRLVASHFMSNTGDKPFVNHKDRCRSNNHHSNLEWVTEAENTHHWRRLEAQSAKPEMAF